MSKIRSQAVSFRIAPEKLRQLELLAAATDRARSWHIERAVDAYLEAQTWQLAHIGEGVEDIKQGRTITHDAVRDWLLSWGKKDELEPPE